MQAIEEGTDLRKLIPGHMPVEKQIHHVGSRMGADI
jgi:hypothetical protein